MWLFFFIVFFIISLGLILNKYPKSYLKILFFVFFIISAFRSFNIGNDTIEYTNLYTSLQNSTIESFTWRYERGFLYFNRILSFVSSNPQVLLVTIAFITCLAYYIVIKKYSLIPWMSVYLFFTLRYFDLSMNIARQTLAMAAILMAVTTILNKKYILFFILVLLATSFHNTAIISLCILFVDKIKDNKKFVAFLAILTSIGFILFPMIFNFLLRFFPTYSYYLTSSYMDGSTRTATILNITVNMVIILFVWYVGFPRSKPNILFFKMILVGLAISIISIRFSLLDRVGDYFSVFVILLLPNSFNNLRYNKSFKFLLYMFILIFMGYCLTILLLRPDWNRIYPYQFFFQ